MSNHLLYISEFPLSPTRIRWNYQSLVPVVTLSGLPWASSASLDGPAVPREMATLLASRTAPFATFVGQMSDHATTFVLALRASPLGMRGVVARLVIFAHGFRRDRLNLIVKRVAIRLVNRATDNSQSGFGSNLGVHAVKHVGIRASLACVPCAKHPAVQDDHLADDATGEGNQKSPPVGGEARF
jgi:hypothetical protein